MLCRGMVVILRTESIKCIQNIRTQLEAIIENLNSNLFDAEVDSGIIPGNDTELDLTSKCKHNVEIPFLGFTPITTFQEKMISYLLAQNFVI